MVSAHSLSDHSDSTDGRLHRLRHSTAHVMADAVLRLFPDAQLAIGPSTDEGFYYDFDVSRPFTPDDLKKIQEVMNEIIKSDRPFERKEMTRVDAQRFLNGQTYKLEIIDGIPDDETISFYQHGKFIDLCEGPHVESTGMAKNFVLLSIAGAYWRGDEKRPMLQRIYGTVFETADALNEHLELLQEAERRDHRRLGRELELFHLDPTAPGMPYWLPKGLKVLNELIKFWRIEHDKRGYQEISAPLINNKKLWETSGHWDHYKDNMFVIPIDENVTYGVKPMNCPNAMVVYNLKVRSYQDLPFRLSDVDILHRNEPSGTLHGLFRVQRFQQDDAHIFITQDQIQDEYERIFEIVDRFYGVFGLEYSFRVGTRPVDYLGDIETWNKAEDILKNIIENHVGVGNFDVHEGEGAFYGPKVDIMMKDAIGRSWQMGTIQLDFHQPQRFSCIYVDKDGQRKTPVVIHRVIYGSLERFIGILIEHYVGAFPFWIAPVQVKVIPIADRHIEYARDVAATLSSSLYRVELDTRNERMNSKIRDAQLQKIPYMIIVGDREIENSVVSIRHRDKGNIGNMAVSEFLMLMSQEESPIG